MAPEGRGTDSAVAERLFREPYGFDFYQAVRLLEWIERTRGDEEPQAARYPVGHDSSPRREIVRFRAMPSRTFPSGSISRLVRPEWRDPDAPAPPPEMTVAFLGLTGPSGVLPQHYTSLVIERAHARNRDTTLRDFFDLFHHRVISFFYRAWEKYRFPFSYERARVSDDDARSKSEDLFTFCLSCFTGLGTSAVRKRLAIDDELVFHYGGHFTHSPRCAVALQRMVADHFGVKTEILQFYGQWLYLGVDDQSCMPSATKPEGQNLELGLSTVAGSRVWDVEGKFRLRLGPVGYREFQDFMPSGTRLRPLWDLTRLYAGAARDYDVQVVLRKEDVPDCQIGQGTGPPPMLGWNTWIRSGEMDHDAEDAVFRL